MVTGCMMKNAALKYLKNGFNVIPAGQTKKALIEWKPYQTERVTETLIDEWWGKWPKANIAIITGNISGIMAVDVDTDEGLEAINEFLSDTFLTPTYTTPSGGRHYWFKYRPGLASRTRVLTDCDVRTDGGYIVVPPSKNGQGKGYAWLVGLSMAEVAVSEIPEFLFDVLKSGGESRRLYTYMGSSIEKGGVIGGGETNPETTKTHIDHKRPQMFEKGRRDNDLFHAANCLFRGGMAPWEVSQVINILAKNCRPEFSEKETEIKIKSALDRAIRRDRNIAAEIREWALTTTGHFLTTDCHKELELTTNDHKKSANMALLRLVEEGLLEKYGERRGCYKLLERNAKEMTFIEGDIVEFPIKLPFGLSDLCKVYPKNIIVIAGSKSAGKTAVLLDIALRNQHFNEVVYLNSEMGDEEWSERLKNMGMRRNEDIKLKAYGCNKDFHGMMDSSKKIFIVDYLEIHDNFYEIAKPIRHIHETIADGVCIVAVQKKGSERLGRGAEFSMEKSRLYLTLDFIEAELCSKLTIVDAKATRSGFSLAGMYKKMKIKNGASVEVLTKEWLR